jgi:hypothetical protein
MLCLAMSVGFGVTGVMLYMFKAENLKQYAVLKTMGASSGLLLTMIFVQVGLRTSRYCVRARTLRPSWSDCGRHRRLSFSHDVVYAPDNRRDGFARAEASMKWKYRSGLTQRATIMLSTSTRRAAPQQRLRELLRLLKRERRFYRTNSQLELYCSKFCAINKLSACAIGRSCA